MVAGSVTKVSVGWSAPSSSMTTSRPASRRRAAAVAPPAPVPTTTASAAYSRSPSSAAPTITFGYAIRCSGGARRSAGAAMEELRAAEHERVGAAGPVDPERGEDLGVLVEGEEDERAEPHQERAPEPARVLERGQVPGGLARRHRREAAPASREEGWPQLDQPEAERQAEAEWPGQVREEALDVAQHVVVDRLVEAVAARPDGGDHRAQDARLWEHPGGTTARRCARSSSTARTRCRRSRSSRSASVARRAGATSSGATTTRRSPGSPARATSWCTRSAPAAPPSTTARSRPSGRPTGPR